jgi:hypothetical protein
MAKTNRKYWKHPKQTLSMPEGRRQLELMFKFANLDLTAIGVPTWKDPIVADYLESLSMEHDSSKAITGSTYFDRLQAHLRERLLRIIEDSEQLWEMPQWSLNGRLQLSIHGREGRFIESFVPHGAASASEISKVRGLTDLRLYELFRDLSLQPKRFRQCPRCKALFYQPTTRPKKYCSPTCAGTVRQARFRKRGRGGQCPQKKCGRGYYT